MKKSPFAFLNLIFLLIIALVKPQSIFAQMPTIDCSSGFQDLVSGNPEIRYKEAIISSPRQIAYYIVKVDLDSSNIDFKVTPEEGLGTTTSTFLNTYGAAVAINGDGFQSPSQPNGFAASEGDVYSNQPLRGLTVFTSDTRGFKLSSSKPGSVFNAVSGMADLIRNGNLNSSITSCLQNCTQDCSQRGMCTIRPRTAIGITSGNELILMVVDGDQPGYSEGVKPGELAGMMKQCNAITALNMDGGGSSTLASKTGLLNHPPGERTVSNHFGICLGSCVGGTVPAPQVPQAVGDPRPRPQPFPCENVAPDQAQPPVQPDSEFHSLRPYQASPCNPRKQDLALYCGNNITVSDTFSIVKHFDSVSYDGSFTQDGSPIDPATPLPNPGDDPSCLPQCDPARPDVFCGDRVRCGTCSFCGCYPIDGNRQERCTFNVSQSRTVEVDVRGAELPIMGYTEPSADNASGPDPKVINSLNPDEETLTNPQKMNEYVSWYLNGVNERAEYPQLDVEKNCIGETTGREGTCRYEITPFCGKSCSTDSQCLPFFGITCNTSTNLCDGIACLLTQGPFCLGPKYRFDGRDACSNNLLLQKQCCVSNLPIVPRTEMLDRDKLINFSGPLKKLLPIRIQHKERIKQIENAVESQSPPPKIRHNQTAGCVYGIKIPIIDITLGDIPAPCYFDGFLDLLTSPLRKEIRLTDWDSHRPPLEDDPIYENQTWRDFLIDYKEWRGLACFEIEPFPDPIKIFGIEFSLPFLSGRQFFFCFDTPTKANSWSNIFTSIPFSSTEDRLGDVKIKSSSFQFPISWRFRVIVAKITNQVPADLFFPHMEEANDLGYLLQQTYAPLGANLEEVFDSGYSPDSPYCDLREIRTNPGDDLFAGELSADLYYEAQVICDYWRVEPTLPGNLCENLAGGECKGIDPRVTKCDKNYGQFDCSPGEYCIVGSCTDWDFPFCTKCGAPPPGEPATCFPNSWGGCVNITPDVCGPSYTCATSCNPPPFDTPPLAQSCSQEVFVTMQLETRTPLANQVWTRLVAGTASVFRKIFPKVGEQGPVTGLWDIATATQVEYKTDTGTVIAGNPSSRRPGANAELYFPHIGGVKEYFLTGIQAILRPKGYGDEIISGDYIPTLWTESSYSSSTCGDFDNFIIGHIGPTPKRTCQNCCLPGLVGWCSLATLTYQINDLRGLNWSPQQINTAAVICNRESGGWTNAFNDGCLCGESLDFSMGLFQINLLPDRCDQGAFIDYGRDPEPFCIPGDEKIIDQCMQHWADPQNSIDKLISASHNGTTWCPWKTSNNSCGITCL